MHIQEYVETTNQTFQELPFNIVDAAVLCALFYGRIENVIEGENKHDSKHGVPVRDFYKQEYFAGMFSDGITDEENKKMLTAAAASPRFRDIKVHNVVVKDDPKTDLQFAAATFAIDTDTDFVCFRGTDGSLHAWREDFDMVFMEEVPSQSEAVEYLNSNYNAPAAEGMAKNIYVAGHSKGGNLAIYSATMCSDNIKNMIKTCYSFDGPGFKESVLEMLQEEWNKKYINISKVVPYKSIIGSIMSDSQNARVVKSAGIILEQHSLYNWEVKDNDFVYVENASNTTEIFDDTLTKWISGATEDQRRVFVDVVFDLFEENNLESVNDLKNAKPAALKDILGSLKGIPHEDSEVMSHLISSLFRSAVRANVANMRDHFGLDSPEDV